MSYDLKYTENRKIRIVTTSKRVHDLGDCRVRLGELKNCWEHFERDMFEQNENFSTITC